MINDGGPAFPGMASTMNQDSYLGMSLRDWFAGMAMQGFMARENEDCPESLPEWAYGVADAMLAEREKAQTNGG